MATVREGNKRALIVVDVQVGVMAEAHEATRIVGNMALAIERARSQGVPVIWVQHGDDELIKGSAEWQWVPELVPAPGELRVDKAFNSSFENTILDAHLAQLGVSHIVLAGAKSNWCIRATAYGALERGYDLTLLKDAHTTATRELPGGLRIEAAQVIAELNITMTWLQYPGRSTTTAAAAEVDFNARGAVREGL